jgi:hypothetical protein
VAIDPKGTFEAARGHAHRARKSAGRLAASGLGFSVAYFLDPAHGRDRRKQAMEMVNHVRRATAHVKGRRGQKTTPAATTSATAPATAPTSNTGPGPGAPQGATNGSRANAGL